MRDRGQGTAKPETIDKEFRRIFCFFPRSFFKIRDMNQTLGKASCANGLREVSAGDKHTLSRKDGVSGHGDQCRRRAGVARCRNIVFCRDLRHRAARPLPAVRLDAGAHQGARLVGRGVSARRRVRRPLAMGRPAGAGYFLVGGDDAAVRRRRHDLERRPPVSRPAGPPHRHVVWGGVLAGRLLRTRFHRIGRVAPRRERAHCCGLYDPDRGRIAS